MKQLLLIILLSTAIFGQSGKSNLTQQQKDSIIALVGGVVVDASVSGYETLSDAITTISTDKKTLVIKDTQDLDANIPANITLRFIDDGKINFTSTDTIKARIEPIDKQIFTGTTPIIYYNDINPIWFGADRTGNDNSGNAFQASFDAIPSTGGNIFVPNGGYIIDKTITAIQRGIVFSGNSPQTWAKQTTVTYQGVSQGVFLMFTSPNDTMFNFTIETEGNRYPGPLISGIGFVNSNSDTSGFCAIRINGKYNTHIDQCSFGGFMKGRAIYLDGGEPDVPLTNQANITTTIENCEFFNNYISIDYRGHSNAVIVRGGRIATLRTEPLWAGSVGVYVQGGWIIKDVMFDMVDTAIVLGGYGRLTSDRVSEYNFIENVKMDGVNVGIVACETSHLNTVSNSIVAGTSYDIIDKNITPYQRNVYLNNQVFGGVSFIGTVLPNWVYNTSNSQNGLIPKTIFNNGNKSATSLGLNTGNYNYVFGGTVFMDSTLQVEDILVDDDITITDDLSANDGDFSGVLNIDSTLTVEDINSSGSINLGSNLTANGYITGSRASFDGTGYFNGSVYSTNRRSFTIKNPTNSEDYFLWRTDKETAIDSIYVETKDSSKTFNLTYANTRAGVGTDVFASDQTLASGEETYTTLDNYNIPKNNIIRLITSDTLGVENEELGLTIYYKEEQFPDLMTNGDCEGVYTDGVANGWSIGNSFITPSEQTGITGSAQGFTSTGGTVQTTLRASGTETSEIGATYKITFYVKRISGDGTIIRASLTPMNIPIIDYEPFTVNGSTWTKCEIIGVATASTTMYLYINSNGGGDTSVYAVDNVTVRKL